MVEQHVEKTLDLADHAYILEMGRIVADGPGARLATDSRVREAYLGL
jgi:branched-chain amino acid transport system ATP-binding protein